MRGGSKSSGSERERRRTWLLLLVVGVLLIAAAAWVVFVVWNALPPRRLTMTTGPEGGVYRELGEKYRRVLSRFGVRLVLQPSLGNVENLQRLKDPRSRVWVGFVSGGLASESDSPGIESLGTIAYYPLWIFCRGMGQPSLLQELKGKRVSIGPEGGGTRPLVMQMLRDNQMESAITPLALSPGPSGEALLRGEIDCACMLTGPDAPIVQKLLADERVSLFHFARADAYVARFPFLRKVVVPEGVGDLSKNLPPR